MHRESILAASPLMAAVVGKHPTRDLDVTLAAPGG
jgi:hypothetical protein